MVRGREKGDGRQGRGREREIQRERVRETERAKDIKSQKE